MMHATVHALMHSCLAVHGPKRAVTYLCVPGLSFAGTLAYALLIVWQGAVLHGGYTDLHSSIMFVQLEQE